MVISAKLQRRLALRRKLHILRIITNSKSVKRSCVIRDAFLYIYKLKLKLEAIRKELADLNAAKQQYLSLINQAQLPKEEVKVEKLAGKGYTVKVVSEKKEDKLVSILEAFEEMGIAVLHARVSCNFCFVMEAIVGANLVVDVNTMTQALLKAIK